MEEKIERTVVNIEETIQKAKEVIASLERGDKKAVSRAAELIMLIDKAEGSELASCEIRNVRKKLSALLAEFGGNGFSQEEVYGVSLEEYCKACGISVEDLIRKKEKDIELIEKAYERSLRTRDLWSEWDEKLAIARKKKIEDKRASIKRLKNWSKKSAPL